MTTIYGDPPRVENLDKLSEYMEQRGMKVRLIYYPGITYDDGTELEGKWVVHVWKETRLSDGQLWHAGSDVSVEYVEDGYPQAWGMLADLIEAEQP